MSRQLCMLQFGIYDTDERWLCSTGCSGNWGQNLMFLKVKICYLLVLTNLNNHKPATFNGKSILDKSIEET